MELQPCRTLFCCSRPALGHYLPVATGTFAAADMIVSNGGQHNRRTRVHQQRHADGAWNSFAPPRGVILLKMRPSQAWARGDPKTVRGKRAHQSLRQCINV